MIRLDGYYQLNPIPFEDGIASFSFIGYCHQAYLFLENGKYLRAGKIDKSTRTDFRLEDFDPKFLNNYVILDNQLIIIHGSGQKWEFSEKFEKIDENIYKNEKEELVFKLWNNDLDCATITTNC